MPIAWAMEYGGGSTKGIKLANTFVSRSSTRNNNATDIVRISVSGKGGALTRF